MGLGFIINSMTISAGSRAIPGKNNYTEHCVKFHLLVKFYFVDCFKKMEIVKS